MEVRLLEFESLSFKLLPVPQFLHLHLVIKAAVNPELLQNELR